MTPGPLFSGRCFGLRWDRSTSRTRPLIIANFPDGSTSGVIFGRAALQAGVDFNEGDTVIFQIAADSRTPSYIRVNCGKIDGSSQAAGLLNREDPFDRLWSLMAALGF